MITVVIPTYNRIDCMKMLLKEYIASYDGSIFSFEIHDSSTSDDIKHLCNEIKNDRPYLNLEYIHYDLSVQPDIKVLNAISKIESEFFFLSSDGYLIDFNKLEMDLEKNDFRKYDVIDYEEIERIGKFKFDVACKKDYIYENDDAIDYCRKYFSHLTCWGAIIVKKDFYTRFIESERINEYIDTTWSFWVACGIFEAADYKIKSGSGFIGGVFYSNSKKPNPMKEDHSWTKGEDYFKVAMKIFNKNVDSLPKRYEVVKNEIIDIFRKDALANPYYLLQKRLQDDLKYRHVKKYKDDIKRIPGYYKNFVLLSLMPKGVLKKALSTYRFMRRKFKSNSTVD